MGGCGYKGGTQGCCKRPQAGKRHKAGSSRSPAPSIIVKVDGLTEEFASVEGRRELAKQYLDASENGRPWFIPARRSAWNRSSPADTQRPRDSEKYGLDKRTVAGIFGVPPFWLASEILTGKVQQFHRLKDPRESQGH